MPRLLAIAIILSLCAICEAADLRTLATDHYLIHTDLDSEFAADLAQRMDAMWEEYAQRLSSFAPASDGAKLEAYLFARKADYMRLTGDRFPNSGGVFIPSQNLLAAFLETQGRDSLRRKLQHEAFHQFVSAAVGEGIPVWLNEGIAQVFEEGIWTGRKFLIGQVPPERVAQLQEDIRENRLAEFGEFMNRSNEQWASNMRYRPIAVRQYNQAWAMTQFLIYAKDEDGKPKFRDRLIEMLGLIRTGEDGHAAFVDAFSDNYVGFQRLFTEWAHNLSPTVEATYTDHQAVLADMLMSLDAQGLRFANIDSFHTLLASGDFRLVSDERSYPPPASFFCDIDGRPLGPGQLFLQAVPGRDTPDIVCHPAQNLEYRTHFLRGEGGGLDYETIVQSR
jgi:hypothetical protein